MLLKECINVYKAFQQISQNTLPLKTSWNIAQNLSKLQPLVESFEEHRKSYIDQLREKATLDSKGEPEVSDEAAALFESQVKELLEEDQKVRLKKVELIDDGQLSIAPNILTTRVYVYKTYPHGLDVNSDGAGAVLTSSGGNTVNVSVTDEDPTAAISNIDWTNAANWTEIGLAGNSYTRVDIDDLISDANNYRLTVNNISSNNLTALSVNDLMGWILQSMIEAVTAAGLGTVTTYTNPDTGLVGDFNGDGLVGSADLIIFLQNFGSTIQSDAAQFDDSSYVISGSSLMDANAVSYLIQQALGGDAWSGAPNASELQNGGTDYQSGFFFSAAQGSPLVGAWDVFESIGSTPSNRSFFGFEQSTDANAPSFQDAAAKIRLTECAVVGWGRFIADSHNIGIVFRIRLKNSSGTVLQTKYHHWSHQFLNTTSVAGSTADAFSVMPGNGPLMLVDFSDQSSFGATDPGVAPNQVPDVTRIEIEFDYYVPDPFGGVFYSLSLAPTVTCSNL